MQITLTIDKDGNVFDGEGNPILPPYSADVLEFIDYHRLDVLRARIEGVVQVALNRHGFCGGMRLKSNGREISVTPEEAVDLYRMTDEISSLKARLDRGR